MKEIKKTGFFGANSFVPLNLISQIYLIAGDAPRIGEAIKFNELKLMHEIIFIILFSFL